MWHKILLILGVALVLGFTLRNLADEHSSIVNINQPVGRVLPTPTAPPTNSTPSPLTIESGLGVGNPSITIGSNGFPLFSYQSTSSLKLVICGDDTCNSRKIKILDADEKQNTFFGESSVVVGADGNPVIVYTLNHQIKIAKCNDIECNNITNKILESDNSSIIGPTSIIVGTDGLPVVVFLSFKGPKFNLYIRKCITISCDDSNLVQVDSSMPISAAIVLGSDHLPIVSYYGASDGTLRFAKCDDVTCTSVTKRIRDSSKGTGEISSIGVGEDGYPLIAYSDYFPYLEDPTKNNLNLLNASSINVLKCKDVSCISTEISMPIIADSWQFSSISLASNKQGVPYIAYDDKGDLKVAECVSANCANVKSQTLDSVGGTHIFTTSLTMAPDNMPSVAYFDYANGAIKFVHCPPDYCK